MKKEVKAEVIQTLSDKFSRASIAILFDYKGMTVEQMNGLRRDLDKLGSAEMVVAKNTLVWRAVNETENSVLEQYLEGPNAFLFGFEDPVPAAKALVEAAKTINAIEIKVGVLEGKALSAADIEALSKLPSKEQLLAQLLATMQAPVSGFVRTLAAVPGGLVNVLTALKDKQEEAA